MENYPEYKLNLKKQISDFYTAGDLYSVISLLENSELDSELCNELVRTYINAGNKTSDPTSLYDKANFLLDKFESEGRNDPYHQFYRGYILYKQGLIDDSKSRFERAMQFASITDGDLFLKISVMLENVRSQLLERDFSGIDDKEKNQLLAHIEANFGKPSHLCSFSQIDLFHIPPTGEHDFNLIVSVGLSGKKMVNPKTGEKESIELCLALPSDYRFNPDDRSSFEIYMLIEVIKHLIVTEEFTGFGYYLEKETGFSNRTAFTGAMLIGLGTFEKESQFVKLDDRLVSFLELLPLRPMELNYRKNHSAYDLLNLFKEKLVMITPFISTRDDVCMKVSVADEK